MVLGCCSGVQAIFTWESSSAHASSDVAKGSVADALFAETFHTGCTQLLDSGDGKMKLLNRDDPMIMVWLCLGRGSGPETLNAEY